MVKAKEEQIFIGEDEQVIELIGAEKQAFLDQRNLDQAEGQKIREAQETQKQLKVSAYTKLGLTLEEINAVL